MMKIAPMIIWSSKLTKEETQKAIYSEVKFLHSNKMVQQAIYVYAMAVRYLLNNPGENMQAFNIAME